MKKTFSAIVLFATALTGLHAQTIDYGMTAATVQSPAGTPLPVSSGGFQLLVASGSFTPTSTSTLSEILGNMSVVTGSFTSIDASSAGQFYSGGLFPATSLGDITTGTTLYALASTSSSFSLSAPWALLSGPVANGWSSPNPTDIFASTIIEFSLAGNQIISAGFGGPGVGAYFGSVPGTTTAPVGVDSNVTLVPEPSTYALLGISSLLLGGYAMHRRRKN